jgi:two-component system, chemotaxis family, protein-glutamate methylesterase/glutaminase
VEDFPKEILTRNDMVSKERLPYEAIVIGSSAGGLDALGVFLPLLHSGLPVPILIVQHISASSDSFMVTYFDRICGLRVKEGEEKEQLAGGTVYFAPPDYHLLVEADKTISLSNEEKVNYSRPSIDVLFETASWAYGKHLIGIILTGANWDGAAGCELIKNNGGLTIVQDPKTASVPRMPEAVIERFKPDHVLPLVDIAALINQVFFPIPTQL